MGAKTWMLAYVDGNAAVKLSGNSQLDRAASACLAQKMFPSEKLEVLDDSSLLDMCPQDKEIVVGSFPGVVLIAAREFAIDRPSELDQRFLSVAGGRSVYLHAMHSVVDWFAYAVWENGKLQRALSLSPDNGIIEDLGMRRGFEEPYWAGKFPAVDPSEADDDYPFPFHPLELGEAALLDLFGYQLEGGSDASQFQPEDIALMRFKRKSAFRRFSK